MTDEIRTEDSLARKIVMFPLVRAILLLVLLSMVTLASSSLLHAAGRMIFGAENIPALWRLFSTIINITVACLIYAGFVRIVEQRREHELKLSGSFKEFAVGSLIGAGAFALIVAILWLAGFYMVSATNSLAVLILPLSMSLASGFSEEILFRGVIFRIMEESLGSWIAIIFSALFFGFAHAGNPNATLFSSIAIALEAGVLLAAAFMLTRKLWLAIGLHFAWNLTQGGIFGVAVSGHAAKGILQSQIIGPELLTGGAFGAEASIFALIICTATGVYMLFLAHKKEHFVRPFWRRKQAAV